MTQTQQNDWSEAWLAAKRHLKTYEARASFGDWEAAGESASQLRFLANELIEHAKARHLPGQWETD